jgi:pSer/pThr/pTyr-binding forkhead associated (FHA) protein
MSDVTTEPCPDCGRPTPRDTSCFFCEKVTEPELEVIQFECPALTGGKVRGESIAGSAAVVVQKTGQRYQLERAKIKIGRDDSNQVVISEDTFASRHHAWVTLEDGDFFIEDLGSTNGTFLNGQMVMKRQVLSAGDKIRVGHTDFTFEVKQKPGS